MNLTADFARSVNSQNRRSESEKENDILSFHEQKNLHELLMQTKTATDPDFAQICVGFSKNPELIYTNEIEEQSDESLGQGRFDFPDDFEDFQLADIMKEVKNRNSMLLNHSSGNFFTDAVQTIRSAYEEEADI